MAGNGGAPNCLLLPSTWNTSSASLEGPAGATSCGFDLDSADPLLGTLQDNAGATPTMALDPASPAVGVVPVATCTTPPPWTNPPPPLGDQRGLPRPGSLKAACDAGAYEVQAQRPTVTAAATTAPNDDGWYAGDVTVAFTCTPGTFAIPTGACPADQVLTGEGPAVASSAQTVTDVHGITSEPSNVVTVAIDRTPPTADPRVSPEANGAGWTNADVTVAWNWADAGGSGVDPGACPPAETSSGEGTIELDGTCSDLAGNSAGASVSVRVDRTAPLVSAAATTQPNANGWYAGDVTVAFTCTDALSGVPTGTCPADEVLDGEGAAVSSTARTVSDVAGNQSEPSNVVTVAIDRTAPTVTFAGDRVYGLLEQVTVTCAATDGAGSGVDADDCAEPLAEGPAWSFGPGSHPVVATATDRAGNLGTATSAYSVTAIADELCILTRQLSSQPHREVPLCVFLSLAERAGALSRPELQLRMIDLYVREVTEDQDRRRPRFSPEDAATLIAFARTL